MKKTIIKTTINTKDKKELQFLILNNNINQLKKEVFELVDSKKRIFSEFALEHNIESIGVEMEITTKGIFCNFIAFNKYSNFDLNDSDRLKFAELLGKDFIVIDKELEGKVLGAFEDFKLNKEMMGIFLEKNFETFDLLEKLYAENGFNYNYLDDIEYFIDL